MNRNWKSSRAAGALAAVAVLGLAGAAAAGDMKITYQVTSEGSAMIAGQEAPGEDGFVHGFEEAGA